MNQKATIGIPVEPHIIKLLHKQVQGFKHLPLRVHDKETYHVPLVQLGWVHEDAINDIIAMIDDVVQDVDSFVLSWEQIQGVHRGDDAFSQNIRVQGAPSEELRDLYNVLAAESFDGHADVQTFAPIINLAQVRAKRWEEERCGKFEPLSFSCDMDVMEIALFVQTEEDGKKLFLPIHTAVLS